MKNFDLNACGVREMNRQEMLDNEGGILPLLLIGGLLY